jgi:hypothetical protein
MVPDNGGRNSGSHARCGLGQRAHDPAWVRVVLKVTSLPQAM